MAEQSKPLLARTLGALVTATCLLLTACGSDDSTASTTVTNGWDNSTAGKADGAPTINDLVEGDGAEATSGSTVVVNYIGALFDTGLVFDHSYGRSPFVVTLGQGSVIAGWDEGIVGMKVGGTRELIIPADMAYGSQARGDIPANATLIFNVELLNILPPPENPAPIEGGSVDELVITDLETGDGEAAADGSTVTVHYILVDGATGEKIDSSWDRGQTFDVTLGAGQVIEGWEQGLIGVQPGTRRRLEIPGSLAYGDQGQGPIGPNASLVFVVDVIGVS